MLHGLTISLRKSSPKLIPSVCLPSFKDHHIKVYSRKKSTSFFRATAHCTVPGCSVFANLEIEDELCNIVNIMIAAMIQCSTVLIELLE